MHNNNYSVVRSNNNNYSVVRSNNNTSTKSSTLMTKREQFKTQIRKSYLNQLFATKRKQLVQKNTTQKQKQKLLSYVKQLLDYFFKSQSYAQAQDIIHKISDQFNKEGVHFQHAIIHFPAQLLKVFIMFPKNKHAIQILYKIISYCYEQTFYIDDNKFCLLHGDNVYEVKLERKELTECQQAIWVLMHTIDDEIASLGQRHMRDSEKSNTLQQSHQEPQQPLPSPSKQYSPQVISQHNNRIQKRLKMYLFCFKQIVSKMNSYLLRYEFVDKYLTKWAHMLLVEYNFGQSCILTYLLFVSRFVLPFKSWIDDGNSNGKMFNQVELQSVNHQLGQLQDQIISKLFSLCVPTVPDPRRDSIPLFSMLVIKSIFIFSQIKLQKVVHNFPRICHLVRVVLNHTSYYKANAIVNVFELLGGVISRFCIEMVNEDTTTERVELLQSVNVVDMMIQMEFISAFNLYFMMENQAFCEPLYQIVSLLIEYCLVFDVNLSNLLYQKSIFPAICHKLDSRNHNILRTNLKSIQLICDYATKTTKRELFAKMVDYGVDERLDQLVYHMDEWVAQRAIRLKDIYFSEDQIYEYTELENELQRYQQEDQEWN